MEMSLRFVNFEIMKKIIALLSLCLVCFLSADGQTSTNPQQAYIDNYSQIAIQEMQRSGIPASITLAQGMLESRYGLSDLAIKGNNQLLNKKILEI